MLWDVRMLKEALGFSGSIPKDIQATEITIDSRNAGKQSIFIAIKANRDGHGFVQTALSQGCPLAIVEYVPENVAPEKCLIVPNTLTALEQLGMYARTEAKNIKLTAVTGSVGKTTVKEMLKCIFLDAGSTVASFESYNNHLGVPLTLCRLLNNTEYAAVEIGMNHPGEIAPLSKMAQPDTAIVTTVTPAHIGNFESIEGILKEKCSIFEGLKPNGNAILLADHPNYDQMVSETKNYGVKNIFRVGKAKTADVRLDDLTERNQGGFSFCASVFGEKHEITLNLLGNYHAYNAMFALCVAKLYGINMDFVKHSLQNMAPVAKRGEILNISIKNGRFKIFNDAYNANPTSMMASLKTFDSLAHKGKKIAIIGGMGELGKDSDQYHREIGHFLNNLNIDLVHVVGAWALPTYKALDNHLKGAYFDNHQDCSVYLKNNIADGDFLFFKGSKSQGLVKCVEAISLQ